MSGRLVAALEMAAQAEAEVRDQAVRAVAWAIARSAAPTLSSPATPEVRLHEAGGLAGQQHPDLVPHTHHLR